MTRTHRIAIVASACIGLVATLSAAQVPLASPKLRVQWTEFKALYDAKKAVVVDVRDAASFEAGHVPGALSVPLDQIEARAAELKKLGKPILLYCA